MRTVRVAQGKGKLSQDVELGPHRLIADAHRESGGDDLGPNPHEYLAIALGTCTSMTMAMYAKLKGWTVVGSQVDVSFSQTGGVETFEVMIHFPGSLDGAQKARLLEIANHCPVHKAMAGGVQIRTEVL
jgi:putative redox protein